MLNLIRENAVRSVENVIKEYRNKTIDGRVIDLAPLREEFCENIVELRNRQRNMHFLCQNEKLTLESQLIWYEKYINRYNDIYWCILKKNGKFIGTVRLYDINEDEKILDQGSFIIDEDCASEAPYAAEAVLMSLDFAFEKLEVAKVINTIMKDNKKMSSLAIKFGFEFVDEYLLREFPYMHYSLLEDEYRSNRGKIDNLINLWISR